MFNWSSQSKAKEKTALHTSKYRACTHALYNQSLAATDPLVVALEEVNLAIRSMDKIDLLVMAVDEVDLDVRTVVEVDLALVATVDEFNLSS